MRVTITLEPDVAAAVEQLRRETGAEVSQAVNRLIRAGLLAGAHPTPYVNQARDLGFKVDVSAIGEVIELLDDP